MAGEMVVKMEWGLEMETVMVGEVMVVEREMCRGWFSPHRNKRAQYIVNAEDDE
jgi:hypothetical protein